MVVDDVVVDADSADMGIPNPNNMDSSSPNSTTNYNDMVCPNRMGRSNHNTNHTKALQQHPTSQTSRLYTSAQPKPYRPKP